MSAFHPAVPHLAQELTQGAHPLLTMGICMASVLVVGSAPMLWDLRQMVKNKLSSFEALDKMRLKVAPFRPASTLGAAALAASGGQAEAQCPPTDSEAPSLKTRSRRPR